MLEAVCWHSGNALASHSCDPGSIPGFGMQNAHVVTKLDKLVLSGTSVSFHTKTTGRQTSTNEHHSIRCVTCFVIFVKYAKFKFK